MLSKRQCGIRKGLHTTLPSCYNKKCLKCLGKEGISGAILTNLLNTFDYILHNLLIVKIATYGFKIIESFHKCNTYVQSSNCSNVGLYYLGERYRIIMKFHSTKPELRFYEGSNPACRVLRMVPAGNKAESLVGQPFRKNNSSPS